MANKKILLVEPSTRTSYPPLGLMKIATYHKFQGDHVEYVVGKHKKIANDFWDKIYITSVFTYNFSTLIKTIHCYTENLVNFDNIRVGGISASLLSNQVHEATGVPPHVGLLDEEDKFLLKLAHQDERFSYLLDCGASIDNLPPDYGIFPKKSKYYKILDNSFLFFSTKGCPNKCNFCAVPTLEPKFVPHLPITPRIQYLRDNFGDKAGLLLLDNNVAASPGYYRIIDEIKDCGYGAGEKLGYNKNNRKVYKQRYVDFNQGVDLRLMDKKKMAKMAEIAIKPLRLAFDSISLSKRYDVKARLAIDCGITSLSNYMLYNHEDSPDELYNRFLVNIRILADNPHVKIFSFPMRYSPIYNLDRKHTGKKWVKREVRATQIILNATHGIVSHKESFFYHAFGNNVDHFRRILLYPYQYIINREHFELHDKRIDQWESDFSQLSTGEVTEFKAIIGDGPLKKIPKTKNGKINKLLEHYIGEHANIIGHH